MSFIRDLRRVHRVLCIQSTWIVYAISYIRGLTSHTMQCLHTSCVIAFTHMRRRVLRSHDGVCLFGCSHNQQNFVIHIHTCYLTNTRYFGITCSGLMLLMHIIYVVLWLFGWRFGWILRSIYDEIECCGCDIFGCMLCFGLIPSAVSALRFENESL